MNTENDAAGRAPRSQQTTPSETRREQGASEPEPAAKPPILWLILPVLLVVAAIYFAR